MKIIKIAIEDKCLSLSCSKRQKQELAVSLCDQQNKKHLFLSECWDLFLLFCDLENKNLKN